MMMSLNLIQSACPTTHSLSVCLLPDEHVLCVVVGLLGAALEDVVVEVGTGAANGARDEVGAGLLARTSAVSSCPSSSPPSCFSLVTFWSLQRRLVIFLRSYCDVPVILLSQLVRVSSPALCLSSAVLSGCGYHREPRTSSRTSLFPLLCGL